LARSFPCIRSGVTRSMRSWGASFREQRYWTQPRRCRWTMLHWYLWRHQFRLDSQANNCQWE
jgi:hypothetical protein